jgi:uncharacterized membrane protein
MAGSKQAGNGNGSGGGGSGRAGSSRPARTTARNGSTAASQDKSVAVRSGKQPAKTGQAKAVGQAKASVQKAQTQKAQTQKVQTQKAQTQKALTRKARDRARARELAEENAVAEPVRVGPPLWLQLTTLVLSLAGLGVSTYLTIAHYTSSSILACSANSVVNCTAVTTSPESKVFGVLPVAVLGLAFFVFMVPMTTPWAWRSRRREITLVRLASVIVGVGFILYLIYVELFQVGFICLWCTSVHVITFLLFVLVALSVAAWGTPEDAMGRNARR